MGGSRPYLHVLGGACLRTHLAWGSRGGMEGREIPTKEAVWLRGCVSVTREVCGVKRAVGLEGLLNNDQVDGLTPPVTR
jgi:hypothetical protein